MGEGEIHALLGENGAGKTTLMNILYGIYTRDSGEILWKGEPLQVRSPGDAIRRGIGMVHQHFMLVPTLTVSENITLGLRSPGHPFVDRRALDARILDISAKYGLDIDPAARVSSLSVGEQQRVEIMKLLYRDARLLILDEPTAVLTPGETDGLFGVLRRLAAEGHAVILITHRIPEVLAVTDRITVLRDGARVATLESAGAGPVELSRLMIGRPPAPAVRDRRAPGSGTGAPVFEMVAPGVSLSIRAGEIHGIAGVDGNGQKELAERILGLRDGRHARRGSRSGTAPDRGDERIRLRGVRIDGMDVAARRRLGVAYVSDDRHRDGLVLAMNPVENMLLNLKTVPGFLRRGFIDRKACLAATSAAVESYGIRISGPGRPVALLSGGNQQKLVLARELSGTPALLVAFQPTRGLDIGATEFVRGRILERRSAGCAILLVSADLEEILALSDRISVMYRGALSDPMPNDGCLDMTRLGLLMAGHAPEACA